MSVGRAVAVSFSTNYGNNAVRREPGPDVEGRKSLRCGTPRDAGEGETEVQESVSW
jgi:hypothetical protein